MTDIHQQACRVPAACFHGNPHMSGVRSKTHVKSNSFPPFHFFLLKFDLMITDIYVIIIIEVCDHDVLIKNIQMLIYKTLQKLSFG